MILKGEAGFWDRILPEQEAIGQMANRLPQLNPRLRGASARPGVYGISSYVSLEGLYIYDHNGCVLATVPVSQCLGRGTVGQQERSSWQHPISFKLGLQPADT
jgi:hypothetical protein